MHTHQMGSAENGPIIQLFIQNAKALEWLLKENLLLPAPILFSLILHIL